MSSKLVKLMLAAKPEPADLDTVLAGLTFPILGSPKLDGIRVSVQEGRLYSRSLKLIPNRAMQELWGRKALNGLDGEIIVGPPTALDCFNRSTSVVMSRDKPATDATFNTFDSLDDVEPFNIRLSNAELTSDQKGYLNLKGLISDQERFIRPVPHVLLKNLKQLLAYEEKETKRGHEGIMLRDPAGGYKHGRSTLKEGGLIAVKRFVDAEAVILDTYEQEENTNEQTLNELGKMKRSTHKAGKVGKETLGGFTVVMVGPKALTRRQLDLLLVIGDSKQGRKDLGAFNIGTGVGLTDAVRKDLWLRRKGLVGKLIKLRYQKVGTMEKPRIPIFLGFRSEQDL